MAERIGLFVKMQGLLFRFYLATYRLASWLIVHTGPLGPVLIKLGGPVQSRFVPRSYSAPNPVHVDGLSIYHTEQPLVARWLAMGLYEPDTTRVLREFVKPGMTVLDVGANIGYFSLIAARTIGKNGRVWAFEPVPRMLEVLNSNVSNNALQGIITVVPQAVSNAPGTTVMYVNAMASGWSSLYGEASATLPPEILAQQERIEIACTTLDEWAAQHDWPPIDLIKMDIEGAEKQALEGMVQLSRRIAQLKLIIEFNVRTLQAAKITPEEFFAAIGTCGFDNISIIADKLQPLNIPIDVSQLLREIHEGNGESVNLFCEKSAIHQVGAGVD